MLDLHDELRRLIAALQDRGADYALCGGLAMAVHGKPRATLDIDLLAPEHAVDVVKEVCASEGYGAEALPMAFAGGRVSIVRLSKVDETTGDSLSVDILVVTQTTEKAWHTRIQIDWEGTVLWVVSREGLIVLKRLRGSGQDRDDISWLEETED